MCVLVLGTVYPLPRPLRFAQKVTLAEDCRFVFLTSDTQPHGPAGSSFPIMSGPFMECGGPWALASPAAVEQADDSPRNLGEFLSTGQMLTNKKVAGKSLLPPCSPNWNVQRCVGFLKPEWRCAVLHEQLAVSPPVSAVSSVINACIFLLPFLSLFPFSLLLLPMDCVPAVAGKFCLWLCFLGILH